MKHFRRKEVSDKNGGELAPNGSVNEGTINCYGQDRNLTGVFNLSVREQSFEFQVSDLQIILEHSPFVVQICLSHL